MTESTYQVQWDELRFYPSHRERMRRSVLDLAQFTRWEMYVKGGGPQEYP